jgi:universal stress protein A
MSTPHQILVATDFSAAGQQAVDYAVALAAKLGAKVNLLHAYAVPQWVVGEFAPTLPPNIEQEIVESAQGAMHKAAAGAKASGCLGQLLIRRGDPRAVIVEVCTELHCDLVVMGTHGRRGVSRLLMGSVAESVVRTAPCPVLTVRPIAVPPVS